LELSLLLGFKKTRIIHFIQQYSGKISSDNYKLFNFLFKFVSENQRDWDRWIVLYLLAYRSAKHETTRISLAEMCFGKRLKLSLDLLHGTSPQKPKFLENNFVVRLKKKLHLIHEGIRQQLDLKSQKIKPFYNCKAKRLLFEIRTKGYSTLEGLKGELPNYKVIGKDLVSQKIKRCGILHLEVE